MTHILLEHGSGGRLARDLTERIFLRYFKNPTLHQLADAAVLPFTGHCLAVTTDAFVVEPLFFAGGDIGKLAVCGTVNDLAVAGALPLYLTAAFVIEEGLSFQTLEQVVQSMAEAAQQAGVSIVAGDTKIVRRGQCDQLFITTTGVGAVAPAHTTIATATHVAAGDVLCINGGIGEHGLAVLQARELFPFQNTIRSDCAALNGLIQAVLATRARVHFMRDATRGGLATVLCELAGMAGVGIQIYEDQIPVSPAVRGACDILGLDPLYIANEGKVLMVIPAEDADLVMDLLRAHPQGGASAIIGAVVPHHPGRVLLQTEIGGQRIIDMLTGAQLPRVC